ncbi:helix-turn-helix transcriptional regulator [Curtobacterium citreum]|uniref:helix-turn-helix transcriptional regulator n=1 Tax=Curtobacterium citreum TaxID=2036 RepID=UPI0025500DC7|nr:helix-turn-helix transcriptional regulator [Curtobacterium citreum]MDK8172407.1 helix-turn-helix transcriptional regulator [Curtobacterium citreum]
MAEVKHSREQRQRAVRAAVEGLPAALRKLRGARVSRARVARYTGIDESTLLRIESTQQPTVEQLLLLCDAFETCPSLLLDGLQTERPSDLTTEVVDSHGSTWTVSDPDIGHDPVVQTLPAGVRETPARHDGTEWLLVVKGRVGLRLGNDPEPVELRTLTPVRFTASDIHDLTNLGKEDAIIVRRMSAFGLWRHAEIDTADDPVIRRTQDDL